MQARRASSSPLLTGISLALLLLLLSAAPVKASSFAELIVFGDSLSAAGNVRQIFGIPQPPYFDGRFSNGPVWVDQLAPLLGLPVPMASLLGGTNYAFGGAETGFGSSYIHPLIPNIGEQINDYLGGNTPIASQLFVVNGGANNINGGETDMPLVVADLSGHITALASAGASSFLISNLPRMGQAPPNLGTPVEGPLTALTTEFNTLLSAELALLRGSLGVTIFEVDTFGIMGMMIDNPAAFGLTNVTEEAYQGGLDGSGIVVGNPAAYLFWDNPPGHPTSVAHGFIAAAAAQAVPEPSTLLLLGTGLALVGYKLHRRM